MIPIKNQFAKRKKLVLKDMEPKLLLKWGEALGWEGTTPVSILAELEDSRLIISRHYPRCVICGGGSFVGLLHVKGREVCVRCASETGHALAGYNYYAVGADERKKAAKAERTAKAEKLSELVRKLEVTLEAEASDKKRP